MMQHTFVAGVTRFFISVIDSTCTEAMYVLKKNHPENVFLMMVCIQRVLRKFFASNQTNQYFQIHCKYLKINFIK